MQYLPKPFYQQVLLFWIVITLILVFMSVVSGKFGHIGIDNDDVLRLVQIRDLQSGQSWFDLSQIRMGPGAGTSMHWSRLVDAPILGLTWIFDIFLPHETAEALAISLWPPLSSLFIIWGMMIGIRHLSAGADYYAKAIVFGFVLLAFFILRHYRFSPGAIDHHNLQLGLMALCVGYGLDPKWNKKSFAFSGIALSLSVIIGFEIIVFAAICCAFFALNWAVNGKAAARGTLGFGLALSLTSIAVFFLTVSPENYGLVRCDAFSVAALLAMIIGGLGLCLSVKAVGDGSVVWRCAALLLLGAFCAAFFTALSPQCLSNPLDGLPSDVKALWLGYVIEAQPLFADKSKWAAQVPYMLGAAITACVIAILNLKRTELRIQYLWLFSLVFSGIILTIYQIRFHIFPGLFAMFILAPWIGRIYYETKAKNPDSLTYLAALCISVPFVWGFPGLMLSPASKAESAGAQQAANCYSENVLAKINTLEPGLIAASANGTAPLLMETKHRALNGNYHRNSAGILMAIEIFTTPAQDAKAILTQNGVKYVHICRTTQEYRVFESHNAQGLAADLLSHNPPPYLQKIGDDLEGGSVTLYRVTPP